MTVGELRRAMEPLTDEAEVLFPAYELPAHGSYKRATRASVEAIRIAYDVGLFKRADYKIEQAGKLDGQAQAALVIR